MSAPAGLWLPGRWLAPLLLALFALVGAAINLAVQWRQVEPDVLAAESQRLRERLSVEQARLYLQADVTHLQLVRGVVGGMGLYKGMRSAFLVQPDGQVLASLVRSDIGQRFDEVIGQRPDLVFLRTLPPGGPGEMAIRLERRPGSNELVGMVPFESGRRLIAVVDIGVPLAQRYGALLRDVLREALLLAVLCAALALVVHVVWFRRARRLADTLAAVGEGRLDARSRIGGGDELALIGAEADRMAERLQQQQQRLRHLQALIDRSPVVVIEWLNQPGWPMSYLSSTVAQWGYDAGDLLGGAVRFADLIHPDDAARVEAEVAQYIAQGIDEYRQEYRLRRADGGWVWVDDRTSLVRDADGRLLTISGVLLDISTQKAAQLELQEQQAVQRLFYELPFIGMAITDPESKRWVQVNDRLCEILGRPRDELLGRSWADMTPSPDLERNIVLFERMKAGETDHYQLQKRFVRGDGGTVHTQIDVRAVRRPDGTLHRLFATVQDITERLHGEQALREQTDLLEQAERLAGLGSWSYDMATQDIRWSDQMYRNIGRDPALGPPPLLDDYLACLHPDDQERVGRFMRAATHTEDVLDAEFRRHPDLGPERWFRASVQRHRTDSGPGWHYSGTVLDITPIKQAQLLMERTNAELELRVQQRTDELRAANHELEAFTYTVSHDLKAPLRGIDGYSQLLEEDHGAGLDDTARGYIARIRRGVQQMGALIADLLDYSHMERRAMAPQPLELAAVVQRVLDEHAADIERLHARVHLDLPPTTLQLDREGLTVVLRNLVGNALKFSRPGEAPQVEIGARREAGRHLIWVRDQGVGFDMKYHDRIFGIFQRLQRAEDYPGTGVGLALVAKAVQRMGGQVRADSRPGAGATFTLEFPA